MKFKLVATSIAFAAGAVFAANWAANWQAYFAPALICYSLVLLALVLNRHASALPIVAFGVGATLFIVTALSYQQKTLPLDCDGTTVSADFLVDDLVETNGQQQRLLLRPLRIPESAKHCLAEDSKFRISYWRRSSEAHQLHYGDEVSASIKLRKPHSSLNPGGFNYVSWLWRKEVFATGYIKTITDISPATRDSIRSELNEDIQRVLQYHPSKGMVLALALAERHELTDQQWRQARETGLAHLLAISGLHLGLVAGLVLLIAALIGRLFVMEYGLAAWLVGFPAVVAAGFYASLAGWPLSTQRAWLMLLVFAVAAAVNWRTPKFYPWAFALVLCVLMQPLNVLDAGFYLSFGAVALLLWFLNQPAIGIIGKLKQTIWLQLVLLVGMLPMQLWFFGGFSLLALPLNLIVVPLFTFIVLPLLLLSCLGLLLDLTSAEQLLVWVADILQLFESALAHAHSFSNGSWYSWQLLGQPDPAVFVLLLAGLFLFALPAGLKTRLLAAPLLLAVTYSLFSGNKSLEAGEFRLTAFDAGQGTALLIETARHSSIYDTGAGWRSGGSAMQSMVLPALATMGINTVDAAIISHNDNDHAGGLDDLKMHYPNIEVIGGDVSFCGEGFAREYDNVSIQALWPNHGANTGNDQSCVIYIQSAYGSALLTGDISRKVETQLIQQEKLQPVDWLLVPHHGSKTSSSLAFINAVRPEVAVITSGHNNRYGLPAKTVVERYRNALPSTRLLNTAVAGAISSEFTKQCRGCTTTQSEQKRWWQ